MGLINRLKRITAAKIDAFLDSLERPELILPQLIDELEKKVKQAANAEAKSLTSVKSARRKLDETAGRSARMQRGAELAMQLGEEETARAALAGQIEADRAAEACQKELTFAETAYNEARAVRVQLQQELQHLKIRKADLLQRAKQAEARKQQLRRKDGTLLDDTRELLSEVSRMEEKVQETEDEVATYDEVRRILGADFSEDHLRDLQRDTEVQRRLEELRKRLE